MYFADLGTRTPIASGPYVRAVGWLDAAHPLPTGDLPRQVADRIHAYAERWGQSRDDLDWPVFMGPHECELCSGFVSSGNFGVPAGNILFVCPEMIDHYVAAHRYLPPDEFVNAIMGASLPGSDAYAEAVARFRLVHFFVRRTYRLSQRPSIYLAGGLYGGMLRAGMVAHVPGEGEHIHAIPIVAVEFVDGPGTQSDVAIQVVAENPEQDAAIAALHSDRVIQITEPLG